MTTNSLNPVDGDVQALIAKIKKQTESFDTVIIKESDALLLISALTTPPAQLLRPVDLSRLDRLLPANHRSGEAFMAADSQGNYVNLEYLVKSLRQQGYEVKS